MLIFRPGTRTPCHLISCAPNTLYSWILMLTLKEFNPRPVADAGNFLNYGRGTLPSSRPAAQSCVKGGSDVLWRGEYTAYQRLRVDTAGASLRRKGPRWITSTWERDSRLVPGSLACDRLSTPLCLFLLRSEKANTLTRPRQKKRHSHSDAVIVGANRLHRPGPERRVSINDITPRVH